MTGKDVKRQVREALHDENPAYAMREAIAALAPCVVLTEEEAMVIAGGLIDAARLLEGQHITSRSKTCREHAALLTPEVPDA